MEGGGFVYIELSMISAFSVEGSRVDAEPSMIRAQSVEGSVLENGTVRDIESQRGRLALFTSNRPRYRPLAWKVQLLDPEPSVICVFIADGCFVYIEPSTIWSINMEGSRLRYGPSVILRLRVEGSTPGSRTIRDSGPKCGRFAPGC